MKTFQYKAKTKDGQLLEGVIETAHFAEATSEIQARGLELLSLEELKTHLKETNPYLFDAIDAEGEKVQGTIHGTDEDLVKHQLEKDFGYKVSRVYRKEDSVQDSTPIQTPSFPEPTATQESALPAEESIIFQNSPRIIHSKPVISEEELNQVHDSIQLMLVEKGAAISSDSRDRLLHLDGMIDLIRESQNKSRWKDLKKEIWRTQKLAEREIKQYEDEKWKAYEQKNPVRNTTSYSDFPQKVTKMIREDGRLFKVISWFQMVDMPNEQLEEEVLAKQQYESIWIELQRFSGALLAFYLVFFFLSYYLKRAGVDDSLLIRIYDTTLFKQIILGIFLAYSFLTIRQEWSKKRLKTDASLVLAFFVLFSFLVW